MADQEDTEAVELTLLAEKTVQQPVKASTFAYCPTLDLLALATNEEKVYVYRLNGQRVVGTGSRKSGLQVRQIHWKPNGQLLAIAWNDNHVRLISPETNRVIHEIPVTSAEDSDITCLGWGTSYPQGVTSRIQEQRAGHGLDALFRQIVAEHALDALADLPRDLALLDIEGAIPKLSLLPSGKDDDVFSSRASMDAMFSPLRGADHETVDVLMVGLDAGSIHLTVYNCFEIGVFDLSTASDRMKGCRPIRHSSHPCSSTHALLVEQLGCAYFIPVDLRFLSFSASGEYLSLLAAKSTQLQNLLRYIGQVQKMMLAEWKACQDLPGRFIQSINATLSEAQGCDFVHAAYHLAVTGHCLPEMKEWLVDILSERGHKRWEKAVASGYENIRRLAHEDLLPALERCVVVVSRLRGLSRYQHSNNALGLSLKDLNNVLDSISCLTLLAHHILHWSGIELRQFTAFSSWLRHEIDVQSSDPSSSANDPAEKDVEMDYPKLLGYIQGPMMSSNLKYFLPDGAVDTNGRAFSDDYPTYEWFKSVLIKLDSGATMEGKLPGLGDLTTYLERRCEVVFRQIAEAQKRNVLFGSPIQLTSNDDACVTDMKMLSEDDAFVAYIAAKGVAHANKLSIFRILMRIENGISSVSSVEAAVLGLESGEVKDIRFVDEDELLVLWRGTDTTHILSFQYRPSSKRHIPFIYKPWTSSIPRGAGRHKSNLDAQTTLPAKQLHSAHTRHTFPADSFKPAQIEVNGRKGRRVVCVLSQDRQRYKIYDLGDDLEIDPESGDGNEMDEDEEMT